MVDKIRLDNLEERLLAVAESARQQGVPPANESGDNGDKLTREAIETSKKSVISTEKLNGEDAEEPTGPVGLDIGTSHIVAAQNKENHVHAVQNLNAFFTVPYAKFAKDILDQKEVMYYERERQYYIVGHSAQSFANMFNVNTRRPMQDGLLSPKEEEGLSVIEAIVSSLIQKPKNFGEILCFSVPGGPSDGTGSVVYHESILKSYLAGLGYTPIPINEGMATVLSELSEDNFTGIGISLGGGMCNVCLSYLSFPVITFSIQRSGDYIDVMAGKAVGEPASMVKIVKEQTLDLLQAPKDRVTTALHIFYDDLILTLLENLKRVMIATEKIPKISSPIPIVLSGGTAMPHGCKEKFETALKDIDMPLEISEVRLAEDLLNTTAKGALIMAMTEAG